MAGRCSTSARKNVKCRCSPALVYECDNWESKLGCWAATSLTILELKRLLLLTIEMLLNSRVIQFAGALAPVILTFVDVGLGFPVAVAAFYVVRKYSARPCEPQTKEALRRVVIYLTVCALLNIVTVILIGFYVNSNIREIETIFRSSMKVYAKNFYHKVSIDDLQLDLQCCGCSSYSDWFGVDWQDYANNDFDDEDGAYELSVPFSCCSRHTLMPCGHVEMQLSGDKSVNGRGCTAVISRILFRITIVGYTMTAFIFGTQIIVILFFLRIMQRVLPSICPSECSCWEVTDTFNTFNAAVINNRHGIRKKRQYFRRRSRSVRKLANDSSPTSTESCHSVTSYSDRLTSSPSFSELADSRYFGSASIQPSVQQQHVLPAPNPN